MPAAGSRKAPPACSASPHGDAMPLLHSQSSSLRQASPRLRASVRRRSACERKGGWAGESFGLGSARQVKAIRGCKQCYPDGSGRRNMEHITPCSGRHNSQKTETADGN